VRRREFISLLSGAALIPPAAHAQQNERIRRVGVIGVLAKDDPEAASRVAAFEQALAAAGWADGRNLRIDYRWTVLRSVVMSAFGTKRTFHD
jgi:putative ABC transport system substrate-binding protein